MSLRASAITNSQAMKILKALAYSFGSGFVAGFILALTNALSAVANGGNFDLTRSLVVGLIVAGVVGGLNGTLVTIKQVFTPSR